MSDVLPFDQPMAPPEDPDALSPANAGDGVVGEATSGQPDESASATAPQADPPQDPAAVNPASPEPSESSPKAASPTDEMPGQCSKCGRLVPKADIVEDDGRPYHRAMVRAKGSRFSTLCGPVISFWTYHVAFTLTTPMGTVFERSRETLPCPMEAMGALDTLELSLQARAPRPPRPPGPVVLGEADAFQPQVTILSWQLMGQGWPNKPVDTQG